MEPQNQSIYQTSQSAVGQPVKKCKHMPIIIVLAILAVGGLGFGVYEIININNHDQCPEAPNESERPNNQELNKYEIRDLTEKTFRLLGSRNGLSIRDYYNDDTGDFAILNDYMPISKLITNDLDEALKVYTTLETTMLDKEKSCNYRWTDGVKDDIDTALGQLVSNISFGNSDDIDCISYGKANDDYYSLWGENMPKINGIHLDDMSANHDFAYGSNLDTYYYHIIGGRGGTCSSYIIGKLIQIHKEQDSSAYVDINAGSFSICMDNAGELYSDIEKENLYKTIEQDNISWDGFDLNEDDYASLHSYRFIFKKNSDEIYSFSTVEKL